MSRQASRGATAASPQRFEKWFSVIAFFTFACLALASAFVWLLPVEVAQQWAMDRAGPGQFERFEAVGSAEFLVWLSRIFGPILMLSAGHVWWNGHRWYEWTSAAWQGIQDCTDPRLMRTRDISFGNRCRRIGFRLFVIAWGTLFVGHLVHAIGQRTQEWPYFRFNSGEVVLPNISDSNRAVIRYLQQATPPHSKILVASDQKLFFLSYYLRPRTIFHRMHPESEHVIPLKDQQRKLSAYRLDELSDEDLAQMPHDYTLEYFEHPDFVDRSRLLEDRAWVSFIRQYQRNPDLIPQYVVRLRATKEGSR